jgi:hypothetical protein
MPLPPPAQQLYRFGVYASTASNWRMVSKAELGQSRLIDTVARLTSHAGERQHPTDGRLSLKSHEIF